MGAIIHISIRVNTGVNLTTIIRIIIALILLQTVQIDVTASHNDAI